MHLLIASLTPCSEKAERVDQTRLLMVRLWKISRLQQDMQ
jgi:hypothetical protein